MFSIVTNILEKPIDFINAKKLILNLKDNKCFDEEQTNIIISAISPKALNCPIDFEDMLRSQVLKSILIDKDVLHFSIQKATKQKHTQFFSFWFNIQRRQYAIFTSKFPLQIPSEASERKDISIFANIPKWKYERSS